MNKEKRNKVLVLFVFFLLLLSVMITIYITREDENYNSLILINGDNSIELEYAEMDASHFEGEIRNGRGKTEYNVYSGIELNKIIEMNNIKIDDSSIITAYSEDNYSATFTGSEILEERKVFVALKKDENTIKNIEEKQGAMLIVFGDKNSKRKVKYLHRIEIT